MAQQNSFDIVSQVDAAEITNALNQTIKEVRQRFDFKGSSANVVLEKQELVLSAEDMIGATQMAGLPTALLLPPSVALAEFLITKMRAFSARWPTLPIILVAEPDRMVDGRRLDQTASNSAPIHEDLLDQLIAKDCKAA